MAIPLPINAMVISSMMLYQIGEIMYSVSLLSVESYILRSYRYKLYRLSPIDSIPIKMSIQGSNRLALLVGLLATVFIISFTILLWTQVRLVAPVALALLLSGYLTIAFGIVYPRLTMRRIIQEAKWREMNLLQQQLDTFLLRMPEPALLR